AILDTDTDTGTGATGPGPRTTVRPAAPGDLGWILERHAVLYRREFGWGADFEASVARIVAGLAADVDDPGQRGWIGEGPAGRLGGVFCARDDPATARLRLLLVEPAARGTGLGRDLVDRCVAFARESGYQRLVLTTQDVCVSARRIYGAAGFTRVRSTRDASYDPTGHAEDWTLTIGA
ncbi:MAG: GNAT family N-acetyltransferase, partial [Frankia sp.]